MTEIDKFKKKMSNIGKNTKEYRMPIDEAKRLLDEINLLDEAQNITITTTDLIKQNIILDGGEL